MPVSCAADDLGLDPQAVLRRVAQAADVVCLCGGPGQAALVQWGVPARPLTTLADLPRVEGAAQLTTGWPSAIDGGALIQLDYEFPVGAWALSADQSSQQADGGAPVPRGWWWPLRQWVAWDSAGRCTLHAADEAGLMALRKQVSTSADTCDQPQLASPLQPAWGEAGHVERVEHIRAAIARGDCYQVNLTLPWRGTLAAGHGRELTIFEHLMRQAPGSHAAFIKRAEQTIISHSPECFVHSDGSQVWSRPIKGTRPRVIGKELAARSELLAAVKDHAELTMIVDLVRNDLGRIASRGGVTVETPASVIDLPYVHHLVATVRADLPPSARTADILAAAFPAGSITGAPKIAAMQLIRELEAGPRGPYCGTIGWIGAGSACALSVAIRTLVITGDEVRVDAGGGIVADSDGAAEWREALAKSAPMRAAVGAVTTAMDGSDGWQ